MTGLSGVEKLDETHSLDAFDCGKPVLDQWLLRWARAASRDATAQTYVVHRGGVVVGYYAICAGSVRREDVPLRVGKGQANRPIPVILLARLAVDAREHGSGLGKALLKDALQRIASAAEVIAARAVLVHAIDDDARSFYVHFGFEASPVDPLQLLLLMKDLRRSLPAK